MAAGRVQGRLLLFLLLSLLAAASPSPYGEVLLRVPLAQDAAAEAMREGGLTLTGSPGNKGFISSLLKCVAAVFGDSTSVIAASVGAGGHTLTSPRGQSLPVGVAVVPPSASRLPAVLFTLPSAQEDVSGNAFGLRTFGGSSDPYQAGPEGPPPEGAGRFYHCDFLPSVMFFLSNEPRLPAYRCVSGRIQALVASEDFRAPYGSNEWIEEVDIQLSDDILSQIFPGTFHHVRGNIHRAVHGLEFKSPHVAINGLSVLNAS